jgi:tetratricopeptide (TPR) repeat protein
MSESNKAVFLSYASQDAAAAGRICESLRAAGIEVWFDQSELRGGDVWDATIKRQIKACTLFVPIISTHTHARGEGYFRLEWKLAVDRSHLMATDQAFLLPVAIDGTSDTDSRVPEKFREVQWTRLPAGETPRSFVERVRRLLELDAAAPAATGRAAPTEEPVATARPAADATAARQTLASPRGARWSRPAVALVAGALVIGLGLAGWAAKRDFSHTATVAPYSIEDRRMSFAVLPFQAPGDDAAGAQVAKATGEQVMALAEADTLWVHVAPRRSVEQAVSRYAATKDLAKGLDVHFLIRGNVARAPAGYGVTLSVVDGDSERVLGTRVLSVAANALTPRWHEDVQDALFHLTYLALEAEVKRARARPVDALDVRDLSFRAYVDWRTHGQADAKGAYTAATVLLNRALALAPDDPLALFLTADVNLCDCVNAWSLNVEEQQAIGAAAMEKYLRIDPESTPMLADKALLFQLRGRYEESLLIADSMLQRDPESSDALAIKAKGLLKLGRPQEALAPIGMDVERYPTQWPDLLALAAAIHYALADYATAAQLAQMAATQMSERRLRSPIDGAVRLTLAAAEARLGHLPRAKAALADFRSSVAGVETIAAIKKWMHPSADLTGYEPFYEGLRLAGVSN